MVKWLVFKRVLLWGWWHIPVIPAFERPRQKKSAFQGQSGTRSEIVYQAHRKIWVLVLKTTEIASALTVTGIWNSEIPNSFQLWQQIFPKNPLWRIVECML